MLGPGQVLTIDGDMGLLAAHADRVAAAGREVAGTGADVHRTWQGLAAVYAAPEAGELLAVTGPVAAVSASVGEDCVAAAAALHAYAAEVAEIQAALDVVRASASALLDASAASPAGESDPALFDRDVANRGDLAGLLARWEAAQQRCAGALRAVTGSGPGGGSGVPVAGFAAGPFAAARFGAVPSATSPAPASGGGFLDLASAAGSIVLGLAAASGEAVVAHPLEALGVVVGGALVVVGAAGEVVGLAADATGIGLPLGVPTNVGSAAVIAAGLTLAGASGAAILQAAGDNFAAGFPAVGTATAPTMIDATGQPWDRNGTWEAIPSAKPAGERIAHDGSSRAHIPYGEDLPDGTGSGGHWYESGRAGKTVFPEDWPPERILAETLDVARNPDQRPVQSAKNGRWTATGTRDGVEILVVLEPDGTVVTGFPLGGDGVAVNDANGDPQPIN